MIPTTLNNVPPQARGGTELTPWRSSTARNMRQHGDSPFRWAPRSACRLRPAFRAGGAATQPGVDLPLLAGVLPEHFLQGARDRVGDLGEVGGR